MSAMYVLSFVIGCLLARRYKVFILVPASIVIGLIHIYFSKNAQTPASIISTAAHVSLLQIGYIVGGYFYYLECDQRVKSTTASADEITLID